MNQYTYFVLGILLGIGLAVFYFMNREEKIEKQIETDQKIYSTELGGLSMCYGYSPDSSINITEYVKSVNAVNKDAKFIYRDISHAICYRGGLAWFTINSNNSLKFKVITGVQQYTHTQRERERAV